MTFEGEGRQKAICSSVSEPMGRSAKVFTYFNRGYAGLGNNRYGVRFDIPVHDAHDLELKSHSIGEYRRD
jgi:hypothetical protein